MRLFRFSSPLSLAVFFAAPLACVSFAGAAGPGDGVYSGLSIHTVNFVFPQAWNGQPGDTVPWSTIHQTLINNKEAEIYIPARLEINCDETGVNPGCLKMDSVGVRYKGNSTFSSGGAKRPFRVSFDEYGIDQRWDGIKGFTLNNSWNDPTHLREKIHMDFAVERAGMAGPRMAYAAVKVNGKAHSFYMMGELADSRLLQRFYGEKDGDLFKAIDGLSNNSDFSTASFTGKRYENKSDSVERGWTRLGQVVTAVNGASPATDIPAKVNMNAVYRGIGTDILLVSMDSYVGVGQNYQLYFPEAAGSKMEWILWDASLSLGKMGATGSGQGTACTNNTSNPINCGNSSKPLAYKIMSTPALRDDYLRALWFLHQAYFAGPWMNARIDSIAAAIRPHLAADTKKLGLTGGQAMTTFDTEVNNLKTFVTNRQASVATQFTTLGITAETAVRAGDLVINEIDAGNGWIEVYNRASYSIDLSGLALSDDGGLPLKWRFPANTFVAPGARATVRTGSGAGAAPLVLSTAGGHLRFSRASGSVIDSLTYGAAATAQSVSRLPDGTGAFASAPATPGAANIAVLDTGSAGRLARGAVVINEFMADNDSVLGPLGTAEDWVELYNTTDAAVDLGGRLFSDNAGNPSKWVFPAGTVIPAQGYLVVWADGQTSPGAVHASWSLSKGGEHLRLSNADSSVVDSLTFGAQTLNRSTARLPNATGPFSLAAPTPGAVNAALVVVDTTTPPVVPPSPRIAAGAVVINEFMADNDSILGPQGTAQDWVELYNTTDSVVALSGHFLSDLASNPSKWAFPAGAKIAAKGYLLVWADGVSTDSVIHASWSLSKGGEHIRFSNADSSVIDSLTFGAQTLNRSLARKPNGTGAFVLAAPTPNASNGDSVTAVDIAGRIAGETFTVGHVAGAGTRVLFTLAEARAVRLSVLDVRGREVAVLVEGVRGAGNHEALFDGASLSPGMYYFSLRAGAARHVRAHVITR